MHEATGTEKQKITLEFSKAHIVILSWPATGSYRPNHTKKREAKPADMSLHKPAHDNNNNNNNNSRAPQGIYVYKIIHLGN
jgi:hypothetical protein